MIIRSIASCRIPTLTNPENPLASPITIDPFGIHVVNTKTYSTRKLSPWSGYCRSSVVLCESAIGNITEENSPYANSGPSFLDLVRSGNMREVKTHMKDANLRETDEDSWTCLHWAVEMGHKDLVEIFLDADPLLLNMKTSEGLSCINIAAWRGDDKMVQLLLQQGAEIDDRTKWGETPLHHAVTFGHATVCEVLLRAGADAHSEDRLKRTPYQIAMQKGTKKVKRILSEHAPPNK